MRLESDTDIATAPTSPTHIAERENTRKPTTGPIRYRKAVIGGLLGAALGVVAGPLGVLAGTALGVTLGFRADVI